MAFVKASAVSGGGTFLKPANHMNDVAILFEPKSIRKNVKSVYKGKERLRDEVKADVTFFRTLADLEDGKATSVEKGMVIAYAMVCSTLEAVLPGTPAGGADGGQIVGVLREIDTKNGSGYVIRDVDEETFDLVVAYYEKREAGIEAAVADAPSFD